MNQPQTCRHCMSAVHPQASRCPHCTSWLNRPITSYWSLWVSLLVLAAVILAGLDVISVPVDIVEIGTDSGL